MRCAYYEAMYAFVRDVHVALKAKKCLNAALRSTRMYMYTLRHHCQIHDCMDSRILAGSERFRRLALTRQYQYRCYGIIR